MLQGERIIDHVNKLRSLMTQLVGIGALIDENDAKALLIKNMTQMFSNMAFGSMIKRNVYKKQW